MRQYSRLRNLPIRPTVPLSFWGLLNYPTKKPFSPLNCLSRRFLTKDQGLYPYSRPSPFFLTLGVSC